MIAAAVVAVAGAAMAAYSTYQQGQSAKKAGEYNAEVQNQNAQQAQDAAAANATDAAYRAKFLLGTQKANAAASGLDPNEGSPLSIMTSTAQQTTLDSLRIRYGGAVKGVAYGNEATASRFGGNAAYAAGQTAAAGTLLRGAGGAVYFGSAGGVTAGAQPAAAAYSGGGPG